MDDNITKSCIHILRSELIPAMGCTEPIAISLAGARVREDLGVFPERMKVQCSGNIIKNAKSVVVPGTNGLSGIPAAAVFGAVCGDSSKGLEVISGATAEDAALTRSLLDAHICTVSLLESREKLHIIVRGEAGERFSEVEIRQKHDRIVRVENERGVVFSSETGPAGDMPLDREYSLLSTDRICEFAETCDLGEVRGILTRQLVYNKRIAEEGLSHAWGARVGRTLLEAAAAGSVESRAKAYAAAASDARMNGCELPVVINSGSGNQGITASLPVAVFAEALGATEERLLRALCLSNLFAVYVKTGIGRLSAFCGAASAGAGAGAGIAFLYGADRTVICDTVLNTLGCMAGIVCDGAKSSCAAKIAASVDAAITGYRLAENGNRYRAGDGLIKKDLDATIAAMGRVVKVGMEPTDRLILETMIEDCR